MVIVSPEYIRFPSKSHEFFDGIVTCLELASIKNLFMLGLFFLVTGLLSLIIRMHCDMSSFDTRMWKSHKFRVQTNKVRLHHFLSPLFFVVRYDTRRVSHEKPKLVSL
jgi:hypothetical protein